MARSRKCLDCIYCGNFVVGGSLSGKNNKYSRYVHPENITDHMVENCFSCDYLILTGERADKDKGHGECRSFKPGSHKDRRTLQLKQSGWTC